MNVIHDMCSEIIISKLPPYVGGANELMAVGDLHDSNYDMVHLRLLFLSSLIEGSIVPYCLTHYVLFCCFEEI